jgi:hypothetical protein
MKKHNDGPLLLMLFLFSAILSGAALGAVLGAQGIFAFF